MKGRGSALLSLFANPLGISTSKLTEYRDCLDLPCSNNNKDNTGQIVGGVLPEMK
jgi:hypothetical protein